MNILEPIKEKGSLFKDNELVCFCFEFTKNDIELDYLNNGRSTILEKIMKAKKTGRCDCTKKNPKGR